MGSDLLKTWCQMLNLAAYTTSISKWCEEAGAVCMAEVIENRQDIMDALQGVLLPEESQRIVSSAAAEAAESVTLKVLSEKLASLLGTLVSQMEQATFQSIHSKLNAIEQAILQ